MKALTSLQNSFDQKIETLNQYLQSLSVRGQRDGNFHNSFF